MMTLTDSTAEVLNFTWAEEDDTVVPGHHGVVDSVFAWAEEDDTVVPNNHGVVDSAFTWAER
jgi:hypothetical protein